jgi:hypothetical protein
MGLQRCWLIGTSHAASARRILRLGKNDRTARLGKIEASSRILIFERSWLDLYHPSQMRGCAGSHSPPAMGNRRQ